MMCLTLLRTSRRSPRSVPYSSFLVGRFNLVLWLMFLQGGAAAAKKPAAKAAADDDDDDVPDLVAT